MVMPGMSGDELVDAARSLRPKLKVIFTTGFASQSRQTAPNVDQFGTVLTKPYRKIDLAAKLRATLDSDP
jgi:CheY-like chemotaxis protein